VATPQPAAVVTALGALLEKQMKRLREHAENEHKASIRDGGWWEWYAPEKEGWSGDPFDLEGMAEPFKRSQHEEEFAKAVADPQSPGVVADLMLSQLQGDILASLERALRARLRTSIRSKMHAAARLYGHGHENGVIMLGQVNYLERLIKAANA